jgi:hypothetical protein
LLLLYTQSDQLGAVAGAFYLFVTGIVGSYIGFATFDDKWQNAGSFDRDNRSSKKDNVDQSTLASEGFPPESK